MSALRARGAGERPSDLWSRVAELGLDKPVGTLVEPREAIAFIEHLPEIEWYQAYVALLLIRSKGLKERFGFKGSDHCLAIRIVPGYHEDAKFKLYLLVRRLATLARFSEEYFVYERHTEGGVEIHRIPHPLVTVMVSPNPCDWVRASIDTISEFANSLREALLNPERAGELVRRIDVRLGANAMRRAKHFFHQIDIDERSLIPEVESIVVEILGYLPARITTPRGEHILVPVSTFGREQAKRWFSKVPQLLEKLNEEFRNSVGVEEPVIEYKKNFQEPLPGALYRGEFIPRFLPSER